jgi:hypothetical protein
VAVAGARLLPTASTPRGDALDDDDIGDVVASLSSVGALPWSGDALRTTEMFSEPA